MSSRIALVTGGNRGLGRAAVEALAGAGTDVVLTYRSHADEAREVIEAVTARGRTAAAIQLDTGFSAGFPAFAEEFRSVLKGWNRETFDVLVNNAGFSGNTVLGATDEQTIDDLFAVHYKGPYLLTQALATAEVPADVAERTARLLGDCDQLRFAGEAVELARFAAEVREICHKLGTRKARATEAPSS